MDALDKLEVQLLERQVRLAEERHAAGEAREAVGLDALKHKLSDVKSKLQTAQAKTVHDAIGNVLSKVMERQEADAISAPAPPAAPGPAPVPAVPVLAAVPAVPAVPAVAPVGTGPGLEAASSFGLAGSSSGLPSFTQVSCQAQGTFATSSAFAGPPEGYGHLARQPVAPVPQAPLHVSAHAPPAHAPQLHAPLAHGPPLHAPCQHFAGGFGANGAQYGMPQQAAPAFEDPNAVSIQQQLLYMQQYQQMLVNGYDSGSAASSQILAAGGAGVAGAAGAAGLAGFQSSTVDTGRALAELNVLEEKVREAEDKVKRAAAQSHHYVGFISKFDTLKGYGFVSCNETFKRFGRDIFIDRESYQGAKIGDTVVFSVGFNKKGEVRACDVQKLNEVTRLKQELQQKKQTYMTGVSRSGMNVQSALELIQGKRGPDAFDVPERPKKRR